MKKLIKHFGSGVKLAAALGIKPNYVYMCCSKHNRATFSKKLAARACELSGNITTVEAIRSKKKPKKAGKQ